MPQMAPLWWTLMFMVFASMVITTSVTVYFLPMSKKGSMNSEYKVKTMEIAW